MSAAQAALGNEVVVLCVSNKDVLPVHGAGVIRIARKRNFLKLSRHAQETLEKIRPEMINIHSAYIPTGISAARWARKEGVPYVICPHENYSGKLETEA